MTKVLHLMELCIYVCVVLGINSRGFAGEDGCDWNMNSLYVGQHMELNCTTVHSTEHFRILKFFIEMWLSHNKTPGIIHDHMKA
jgi:hypothetical protein